MQSPDETRGFVALENVANGARLVQARKLLMGNAAAKRSATCEVIDILLTVDQFETIIYNITKCLE